MIKLFIKFLIEIGGIPKRKIRAYLLLYPDLNQNESKSFWIQQLGLKAENFNKCIVIKGSHKARRLKYGVGPVGISSSYLKEKIFVWLNLLPRELLKNKLSSAGVVQ